MPVDLDALAKLANTLERLYYAGDAPHLSLADLDNIRAATTELRELRRVIDGAVVVVIDGCEETYGAYWIADKDNTGPMQIADGTRVRLVPDDALRGGRGGDINQESKS